MVCNEIKGAGDEIKCLRQDRDVRRCDQSSQRPYLMSPKLDWSIWRSRSRGRGAEKLSKQVELRS